MRTTRTLSLVLAAVSWCLWMGPPAWAQDPHAQDPIQKAGRGIVNLVTGWIEIPKQVHLGVKKENPVTGFSGGLFKGIGLTVLRVSIGLFETVTFPIPYPARYASPYATLELPDYAWE